MLSIFEIYYYYYYYYYYIIIILLYHYYIIILLYYNIIIIIVIIITITIIIIIYIYIYIHIYIYQNYNYSEDSYVIRIYLSRLQLHPRMMSTKVVRKSSVRQGHDVPMILPETISPSSSGYPLIYIYICAIWIIDISLYLLIFIYILAIPIRHWSNLNPVKLQVLTRPNVDMWLGNLSVALRFVRGSSKSCGLNVSGLKIGG